MQSAMLYVRLSNELVSAMPVCRLNARRMLGVGFRMLFLYGCAIRVLPLLAHSMLLALALPVG